MAPGRNAEEENSSALEAERLQGRVAATLVSESWARFSGLSDTIDSAQDK